MGPNDAGELRPGRVSGHGRGRNPKYDEIAGYPCYPSIAEIPFVPDSVMVSVNRDRVLAVVEEAAAKGIKGAVVIAIGFAEAGADGRRNQERLAAVAREAGMSIIGPNCQGASPSG